jgi:2,3-bisphosphoglycerate-independent phosphoglycerate mutase
MTNSPKPLLQRICHSFGSRTQSDYTAIALTQSPSRNSMLRNYAQLALDCSGITVGLPDEQMGTPKVSHLAELRAIA